MIAQWILRAAPLELRDLTPESTGQVQLLRVCVGLEITIAATISGLG
jgi:hypothetical protein